MSRPCQRSRRRSDRAACLAEELRPGVQVMCAEVAGLAELIGPERAPLGRDPLRDLLDQHQIAARHLAGDGGGQLIHQDDLGAERRHHARALHRVAAQHYGHEAIALDPAHHRDPSRCCRWSTPRPSAPAPAGPAPRRPRQSAARMRSFLEKPGLRYSSLARMRPCMSRVSRDNSTTGVSPIASTAEE